MAPTPLVVTLYIAALMLAGAAGIGVAVLLHRDGRPPSAVAIGGGGAFMAVMTFASAAIAPLI
jgi:hypothetical protein